MAHQWSRSVRSPSLAILCFVFVAVAGCSSPGEDVRVTLCKDMASGLLNAPSTPVWREARAEPRRLDRLAIHLSFEAADPADGRVKPMHATCFYRYDAVEETAMTLADPLSAFSTSPSGMTLNGREVANPLLAEAVKEVMLKQGREFLERARRGIEEAADQARERLNGLQSSD